MVSERLLACTTAVCLRSIQAVIHLFRDCTNSTHPMPPLYRYSFHPSWRLQQILQCFCKGSQIITAVKGYCDDAREVAQGIAHMRRDGKVPTSFSRLLSSLPHSCHVYTCSEPLTMRRARQQQQQQWKSPRKRQRKLCFKYTWNSASFALKQAIQAQVQSDMHVAVSQHHLYSCRCNLFTAATWQYPRHWKKHFA